MGLDEQQEMSNRWVKTVTKKLSPSHLENVAALADLRQDAASELADIGLFVAGDDRDRFFDTVRKRRAAVEIAITAIKDSPLFTDAGRGEIKA